MKNKVIVIILLAAISCTGDIESSNSCIEPPKGIFEHGEINTSFTGSIRSLENGIAVRSTPLDSIDVGKLTIVINSSFSDWVVIEALPNDSINFYSGDLKYQFSAQEILPVMEGGHIISLFEEKKVVYTKLETVSQNVIDGECYDVIKFTGE